MAGKIPMKCEEGFIQPFEAGDFVPCDFIDPSCSGGAGGGVTEEEMNAAIAAAVAALRDGAPAALNTLNELAAAIGDDSSFSAHVATALASKIPVTAAGVPNGVGTLDAAGRQPLAQMARREVSTPIGSAAGVLTIDWSLGNMFTLRLLEDVTSVIFTNYPTGAMGEGQGISLLVQQHNVTLYTMSGWPADLAWFGGIYTPSAVLDVVDEVAFSTYGADIYGKWLKAAA